MWQEDKEESWRKRMNKITIIFCLCLIRLCGAAVESAALETVPTIKSLGLRVTITEQPINEQVIRGKAANTLLEIYYHLNRAGTFRKPMSDGGYELPVIPGEHWDVVRAGDVNLVLVPKINCSIVDALNDIRTASEGTIRIECYTASVIAKIALGDCFLAPDRKNYRNSSQCFRDNAIPADKLDTARLDVLRELFFERPEKSVGRLIETGDFVYLFGHPNYKNIGHGPYDGENVYTVGYGIDNLQRYFGFGEIFKTGPKTAKQIQWNLAVVYAEQLMKITPELDDEVFEIEKAFQEIRAIKFIHRCFDIKQVMGIR